MELSTAVTVLVLVLAVIIAVMLAVLVYLAVKLFRTYSLVNDPRMSGGGKAAFWGSVVYMLSPIDLLPDPILIDDIGLVLLALTYITKKAKESGIIEVTESAFGPKPKVIDLDVIDVTESPSGSKPRPGAGYS